MKILGSLVSSFSGAVLALTVAGVAMTPVSLRAQDLGIEIGSTAPSVKVHTLDGREVDLAQYSGKSAVIMEFWATWCPNCKELEPAWLSASKKYGSQVKFVQVAVSVNESPDRVKAFVAKHGLPGDQYFDTKGNATGAYDAPATSYVVVINKAGKVVYTGLGGKQNLDAAIKKAL
ncbi:MAG: TlpA disulfide reductase family protein [bacterium]